MKIEEKYVRRFWEQVPNRPPWPDMCWEWTGMVSRARGYGRCWIGKEELAHRAAWLITGSDLPKDHELDHACRNRLCVRPEHLSLVEAGYNIRQGAATSAKNRAAKTHCKYGHEFTEGNTAVFSGKRTCRACRTEIGRRRSARLRANPEKHRAYLAYMKAYNAKKRSSR